MRSNLKSWRVQGFIYLGLLCLPALMPLMQPGFPATHDGLMHLYRLLEFDTLVRSGVLYPRWAPDFAFGYGYPVFNFYPTGSLYVALFWRHALGMGYVAAMKWTFAIGLLFAAWAMRGLAKELLPKRVTSHWPAILSSVAYVYAPYYLADIYARGALSQAVAYGLMPLVLWSLLRYNRTHAVRDLAITAVSYAGLIYVHHVTAFFFTSYYLLFCGIMAAQQRTWRWVWGGGMVLLLALGLSATFWLPALFEAAAVSLKAAITQGLQVKEHFINFDQPFQTTLLYDFTYDGIAFRMGLLHMVLLTSSMIVSIREPHWWRTPRLFFVLAVLVYYLCQFPFTLPLWQLLPMVALIQFPWRLLIFVNLSAALLVGYGLARFSGTKQRSYTQWWLFGSCCLLTIVPVLVRLPTTAAVFEEELTFAAFARWERANFFIGTTSSGEYLPSAVDRKQLYLAIHYAELGPTPPHYQEMAVMANADQLTSFSMTPNRITFQTQSATATCIRLPHFYFPGWRAWIDGESASIHAVGALGLMGLCVPAGTHQVVVRFQNTWSRTLGGSLTGLTICSLLLAVCLSSRKLCLLAPTARLSQLIDPATLGRSNAD